MLLPFAVALLAPLAPLLALLPLLLFFDCEPVPVADPLAFDFEPVPLLLLLPVFEPFVGVEAG